ncbi:MAG: hypothetical protein HRU30_00120 [Rhodobacteraceae bacterium]|nr:hypothetical protein [Paracoccaceae bacterium]
MFFRNPSFALIIFLAGCATIEIDRTTSSAWYYERYKPAKDRSVVLRSGPARVLVFKNVHASFTIYDEDGNAAGHADAWRSEIEVFFPKDQLPEDANAAAKLAVLEVCRDLKIYDTLEDHPHYIRYAADC